VQLADTPLPQSATLGLHPIAHRFEYFLYDIDPCHLVLQGSASGRYTVPGRGGDDIRRLNWMTFELNSV